MKASMVCLSALAAVSAGACSAQAQSNRIVIDGGQVRIQSDTAGGASNSIVVGNGSTVITNSGVAGPGVPGGVSQGVSVVNGNVFIDGDPVPPDAKEFTGRSGQTYIIERKGGSVSVRSK